MNVAKSIIAGGQIDAQAIQSTVKDLTSDERLILAQYLGVLNISKTGGEQLQTVINSILGQSL